MVNGTPRRRPRQLGACMRRCGGADKIRRSDKHRSIIMTTFWVGYVGSEPGDQNGTELIHVEKKPCTF